MIVSLPFSQPDRQDCGIRRGQALIVYFESLTFWTSHGALDENRAAPTRTTISQRRRESHCLEPCGRIGSGSCREMFELLETALVAILQTNLDPQGFPNCSNAGQGGHLRR